MRASLILNTSMQLGESALWDAKRQLFWCADITGGKIHSYSPDTGVHHVYSLNDVVTNLILEEEGLLISLSTGMAHWKPDGSMPRMAGAPAQLPKLEEGRFNDGKCDAKGRLWIGLMRQPPGKGTLYRWDGHEHWDSMIEGIGLPNGIAWNADHTQMYFVDTAARTVWAFPFSLETGELGTARAAIRFSQEDGQPDGMTIDEEGMLWIAHWGGFCVGRWNPETGECLQRVYVPARHVSSCAFGGRDLSTLFITTASEYMPDEDRTQYPLSGGVFTVQTDVRGTLFYSFHT